MTARTRTPTKPASAGPASRPAAAASLEPKPTPAVRNGSAPLSGGSTAATPSSPIFKKTMSELQRAGTAQNRKVYARHGVKGTFFGVSFATLRTIAKKIKVDHDLARELWATGNHDARMLATMVAEPAALTASELDQWVRQVDNYVLADAFSTLVARSPQATSRIDRWTRSKREFERRCGFGIISAALKEGVSIFPALLDAAINQIEREIHSSANRAREGMNHALIAIGSFRDDFYDRALNTASRIGKVEIDHGETGCKDFDAVDCITKARKGGRKAATTRKGRKSG